MADIEATFKGEDENGQGEIIGPLILWDHDKGEFWKELPDWLTHADAERLARENGWRFTEDM
jgi:hypothetical protein